MFTRISCFLLELRFGLFSYWLDMVGHADMAIAEVQANAMAG